MALGDLGDHDISISIIKAYTWYTADFVIPSTRYWWFVNIVLQFLTGQLAAK